MKIKKIVIVVLVSCFTLFSFKTIVRGDQSYFVCEIQLEFEEVVIKGQEELPTEPVEESTNHSEIEFKPSKITEERKITSENPSAE